jgi:hypothetical protein
MLIALEQAPPPANSPFTNFREPSTMRSASDVSGSIVAP